MSGVVRDGSGAPLDAYVYVLDEVEGLRTHFVTRTARDGSYVVGGIPDGAYHVCVDTNLFDLPEGETGYSPECLGDVPNLTATQGAGTVLSLHDDVVAGIDFALEEGVSLSIRVIDPEGNLLDTFFALGWDNVAAGVLAPQEFITSRGPGVARLTDLPAGAYYICAGDTLAGHGDRLPFEDTCHADLPAPALRWTQTGEGTAGAAADGATVIHLEPGDEEVVTITLPRRE